MDIQSLTGELARLRLENEQLKRQLASAQQDREERLLPKGFLQGLPTALIAHTLDQIHDLVYWLAPDGQFLYANEAFCKTFGFGLDALLDMNIRQIGANREEQSWRRHWEYLKRQRHLSFESVIIAKDKSPISVGISASYVSVAGQEYECCIAWNTAERKRAAELLKREVKRKTALLKAIPDLIYLMHENGLYLDYRGGNGISYIPEDKIVGSTIYESGMPAEIIERIIQSNQKALETGEPQTFEYGIQFPDGTSRYYENRTVRYDRQQVLRVVREVTDRRRMEERLRLEEARKQALLQAMPDLIYVMNERGDYLDIRGGNGLTYIPEEQVVGTNIRDSLLPTDIIERILKANEQVLRSGDIQTIQYTVPYPNRSGIHYESKAVLYGRNQVLRIVRDISERIRAEETILAEQYKNHSLFLAIPDHILIFNALGDYIDYKRGVGPLALLPDEDLIGSNIRQLRLPEETEKKLFRLIEDVVLSGELHSSTLSFMTEHKVCYLDIRAVRYAHRQAMLIVRDVSDIYLAEMEKTRLLHEAQQLNEELQANTEELYQTLEHTIALKNEIERQESRYRALVDASPDAIIVVDRNRKVGFFHLPGTEEKHFAEGMDLLQLVPAQNAHIVIDALQTVFDKGESVEFEMNGTHLEGDPAFFLVSMLPVKNSAGQVVSAYTVSRDISLRKASEERIRKINEELVYQNTQLNHYGYVVSHLLRAPIATLLGLIQVLDMQQVEDPEIQSIARLIESTAHQLDSVVKDLSYALSATRPPLNEFRAEVYLPQLVEEVCQVLDIQIKRCSADIRWTFSPEADTVYTVRSMIQGIFEHLLSNSLKFQKKGVPPIIFIYSTREPNGMLSITIQDNGMGIDLTKYQSYLFQLYKRFHFHVEGKGIGLYLVKTQIEMLGGQIALESQEGIGTTVRLNL